MRYQIIYEDDVIEKDLAKMDGFNRQRIIKEVGEKLSVAPNQFGKPLRRIKVIVACELVIIALSIALTAKRR